MADLVCGRPTKVIVDLRPAGDCRVEDPIAVEVEVVRAINGPLREVALAK